MRHVRELEEPRLRVREDQEYFGIGLETETAMSRNTDICVQINRLVEI